MESPVNVDEKESSFFENKYAEDFEERDAEVVVIEEEKDNKEATIIVNRVARDIHLMRKEHNLKFQGSPLGRHTPKILPHPIKGKSIGVFIVSQHTQCKSIHISGVDQIILLFILPTVHYSSLF